MALRSVLPFSSRLGCRRCAAATVRFSAIESGSIRPEPRRSGGNQQKVIIARWLRRRPKVLLLDEPTQGVDVGARAEIYQLVRKATAAGTSVILVVSEPEELAHASDRVAVLRGGRITTVVDQPIDAHRLTELMNSSEGQP